MKGLLAAKPRCGAVEGRPFILFQRKKYSLCCSGVRVWRDCVCMGDDQRHFLTLMGCPPARLTVEQAAWVLGCQAHDVPVLIASRLLRPLGNPMPNATKYFSTSELLELVKDRSFLTKMTNAVSRYWQEKNARKKGHLAAQTQGNTDSLTLLAAG